MSALDDLRAHLEPGERKIEVNGRTYITIAPKVCCADGFTMSVQVGSGLYCEPRNNEGDWYRVEVGYPSEAAPSLLAYADEPERPTKTIYGYVPIEVVAQVIDEHGGFAATEAPQ